MKLADLPTPCAVVDLAVVERNTARMSEHVARLGARLRPHVKTHKCAEAARLSVRGHFGGITVSTLAEVRFFAAAGFTDITYAVPLAPARASEAASLASELERLQLLVDSSATVDALEDEARRVGRVLEVLLKVDCGYHRAGVDPTRPESRELARRIALSRHLDFRGLLTHGGHSYDARDPEGVREVAKMEREVTVGFAEALRDAGIEVPDVSIGSTPTIALADDLSGVTEVRPGNYVFFDVFQATLGTCDVEDVAVSVLASVIGSYPERGQAITDSGALALSSDPGPRHIAADCGFGRVQTLAGEDVEGIRLRDLSQEHGKLDAAAPPAVGTKLRILPNHSCLTAALHERFIVVRGDEVVGEWRPARGW